MPFLELKTHFEAFLKIINQMDKNMGTQLYIKHIISLLNDVILISTKTLERVCEDKSTNNVICLQSQLIHELQRKISAMQNLMIASVGMGIMDYDEWLQSHCDLATD